MRFSFRLLRVCSLALLPLTSVAQTADPPKPDPDGVYEVSASSVKKLASSPEVEFPRELSAYEITDSIAIKVTVSPEGRVAKAKAVGGKVDALKEAVEKTLRKWAFEPYLINGTPVPVRTEFTFNFTNTLDNYRDPNGEVPVRLAQKTAQALVAKRVNPWYPDEAKFDHIQGTVELRVIVGEDGRVHALHILKGHPKLAAAAYDAVRQWQFKPYVENGKTLPVDTNVDRNV